MYSYLVGQGVEHSSTPILWAYELCRLVEIVRIVLLRCLHLSFKEMFLRQVVLEVK